MKNSKSNFLRRRQRINKHFREACAAGVLPISRKPDGTRVVLLGYGPCSQDGVYQNFWSDFGGKLDPAETAKDAALREFHEETAYFFVNDVVHHNQLLKLHGNEKYVSFVAEVPYADINAIQKNSLKVRSEGTLYERNHVEMESYRWVNLDLLLTPSSMLAKERLYPPFIDYHLSQRSVQNLIKVLLHKNVDEVKCQISTLNILDVKFLTSY